MKEKRRIQEFRLKNIDERINYFLEDMNLMSKKVCTSLNYIKHFLLLASAITEWISTSPFTPLIVIPIVIASSATVLKIWARAAGI